MINCPLCDAAIDVEEEELDEGDALICEECTEADASGIRRAKQNGAIDDAMRARAQAFVEGERAVFVAVCNDPPSLLMAASPDSGVHAGNLVKAAVSASGGRGGGNQTLAQGSVPDASALEMTLAFLSQPS